MTKILLLVFLTLALTACLEEKSPPPQPTQCFDILQSKDSLRPVMFNKCTGETWMLTYINLYEGNKPTGQFTYRWSPLVVESDEPRLSYGK